jgi:hypothetical protein
MFTKNNVFYASLFAIIIVTCAQGMNYKNDNKENFTSLEKTTSSKVSNKNTKLMTLIYENKKKDELFLDKKEETKEEKKNNKKSNDFLAISHGLFLEKKEFPADETKEENKNNKKSDDFLAISHGLFLEESN